VRNGGKCFHREPANISIERDQFFINRVIPFWNNLHQALKEARKLNNFKAGLDNTKIALFLKQAFIFTQKKLTQLCIYVCLTQWHMSFTAITATTTTTPFLLDLDLVSMVEIQAKYLWIYNKDYYIFLLYKKLK